jgi:hypothetical protein
MHWAHQLIRAIRFRRSPPAVARPPPAPQSIYFIRCCARQKRVTPMPLEQILGLLKPQSGRPRGVRGTTLDLILKSIRTHLGMDVALPRALLRPSS